MQNMCGKDTKIYELFDYIVGVSTGALIAVLLGGLRLPIDQIREIYIEVSVRNNGVIIKY